MQLLTYDERLRQVDQEILTVREKVGCLEQQVADPGWKQTRLSILQSHLEATLKERERGCSPATALFRQACHAA